MAVKKKRNTKNFLFLDAPRIANSCGFLTPIFRIRREKWQD